MKNSKKILLSIGLAIVPLLGSGLLTSCAIKQDQESVGQYVDGGIITTKVKSKILADKRLRNTTITVQTYQNKVQLSGFVNNQRQKAYAEAIAYSVEGVKSVNNALLIKK